MATYLLSASAGVYEDRETWTIATYEDKKEAERACALLIRIVGECVERQDLDECSWEEAWTRMRVPACLRLGWLEPPSIHVVTINTAARKWLAKKGGA